MQIREKPSIFINMDVEHLMKGKMLDAQDVALDVIKTVAERKDVQVDRVLVRLSSSSECDCENVIYEIHTPVDDETGFEFWEAVSDALAEAAKDKALDEGMRDILNDRVLELVESDCRRVDADSYTAYLESRYRLLNGLPSE